MYVSTVKGVFWAILSNLFNLVKTTVVQECDLDYQKGSYLNYHDGFKFIDLENSIDAASSNWAISIKSQKKIAPIIVRTFLPSLDDFQIFAKVPHLWIKFNEKYATWDRTKFCVRIGAKAPKNGLFIITSLEKYTEK